MNEVTNTKPEMMGFGIAIKTCFHKYGTFKGRATRAEFWWFALFMVLLFLVVSVVECLIFGQCEEEGELMWLIQIAIWLPSVAVSARRLHDTGHSGWFQMLAPISTFLLFQVVVVLDVYSLVTVAGTLLFGYAWVYLIKFWCSAGDPEPNEYGDPPVAR